MPLLISPDLAQLGEHHDETVHPARLRVVVVGQEDPGAARRRDLEPETLAHIGGRVGGGEVDAALLGKGV